MSSTDHGAWIAVRTPAIVDVARYYGTTIHAWLPADPHPKGDSEATVRVAKADLPGTVAAAPTAEWTVHRRTRHHPAVNWVSTISVDWTRPYDDEVIVTATGEGGSAGEAALTAPPWEYRAAASAAPDDRDHRRLP